MYPVGTGEALGHKGNHQGLLQRETDSEAAALTHKATGPPRGTAAEQRLAKAKALLKAQLCMSVHRHSCKNADGRHKQTEAGKGMV